MPGYRLERSLEVEARAAAVWEELRNARAWPSWKPFIPRVEADGPLCLGARFKIRIAVKGPAVPISLEVCRWEQERAMAWRGGIPAAVISVHTFILEPRGDKTLVVSQEEFSGALVGLMRLLISQETLHSLHDQWLWCIKNRVEKKRGQPPAGA